MSRRWCCIVCSDAPPSEKAQLKTSKRCRSLFIQSGSARIKCLTGFTQELVLHLCNKSTAELQLMLICLSLNSIGLFNTSWRFKGIWWQRNSFFSKFLTDNYYLYLFGYKCGLLDYESQRKNKWTGAQCSDWHSVTSAQKYFTITMIIFAWF